MFCPLQPPARSRSLLLAACAVLLLLLGVGLMQMPQQALLVWSNTIAKFMGAASSSGSGWNSSSSWNISGATGSAPTQQPEPAPDQVSVLVTLMNPHWWTARSEDFTEPNCSSHRGKPFRCRFVSVSNNSKLSSEAADELVSRADGLLYHIHPPAVLPAAARAGTPVVLFSLESTANYPEFANTTHETLEHSYRTCAQVYQPYYAMPSTGAKTLFQPPEPFANKVDAVLYVNSNCWTKNGRQDIVRELRDLMVARRSQVQLHSYGRCDQNVGKQEAERFAKLAQSNGRRAAKVEFGRQYKFCIAMENSNDFDYVTEKVYQALSSGCIPIYYGAPNIADYVPDVAGLVMVQQLGTVARLLDELERLATNETAYNEKMAWRSKPIEQQSPGFQRLHAMLRIPNGRCRLCKLLAEHRESPRNYTPCHANSTWQEAQSRALQGG